LSGKTFIPVGPLFVVSPRVMCGVDFFTRWPGSKLRPRDDAELCLYFERQSCPHARSGCKETKGLLGFLTGDCRLKVTRPRAATSPGST